MSLMTSRATGTGNIATTVTPGAPFQLEGIEVHLSAAGGANNLTVTLDAGAGAAYDVVMLTQDMTSAVDYIWKPTRPIVCNHKSDAVVVAWTNGSGRTFGLAVHHEPI